MSIGDVNMNGFDADKSAYERQNRVNPPEFAPGQGDNSTQDIFSNEINTTQYSNINYDTSGGNIFGNALSNNQSFNTGSYGQTQQPVRDESEIFWDAVKKICIVTKDFLSDYIQSFGKVTPCFWSDCGMRIMMTGVGVLVGGIILSIFGLKFGLQFSIGGSMASAVGVIMWLFLLKAGESCTSMYKEDNEKQDVQEDDLDLFGDNDTSSSFDDSFEESSFEDDDDFFSSDDEDDDDELDDEFDWGDEEVESQPVEGEDKDKALESMPEIQKGMYTRQFLYEQFTKVLPCYKPDFATMKEYDEDDEEFLYWGDKLQDAASASGMKDENLPELESLKENLFTIEFKCNRPTGFKPEVIGQELANIYTYEMHKDSTVAFDVKPVGLSCFITLYTGDSAMISLRDMYKKKEDFILDSSKFMPVVLGVGTSGEVYTVDLKKVESMLVTGMPRSGKTWFVQCLLYQMCALASPSDVNIYILDPKDGISDYKRLYIPHIKSFDQTDEGVLKTLRYIVRVEGAKRKKLLGDAGCVKIWDYKERYPDVKLPVIYLVIDEMVSFAGRMDKETKAEFRALLRELVSQLPALGIRVIMIPHIVKDEFIEKSTSDLIMCRISVRGDSAHIEQSTGTKPREFRHKLTNIGDMAVRLSEISPDTTFIHSPVLTSEPKKNEELFDYMRRVWARLDPDSIKGSYAENADLPKEQEELLKNYEDFDILDDDIF